ncbi:MAG: hypothetical protein FJX54_23210 [Alphaproteobacteria bacterium]|nr:hypothetical protein [Alphaproteobacteria bacterium]
MSDDSAPLDPLSLIALRHGCDKYGAHFYTSVYHELLQSRRERVTSLLEIGVGGYQSKYLGGASLAMWAEYLPRARIVGIDLHEKRLDLGDRITILQGSQDDLAFLDRVVAGHGPFDVIVDDGSHVPAHIVTSFGALFPALSDGGLYVIEDTQTAYWPDFGGGPDGGPTVSLVNDLIEGLHHQEMPSPSFVANEFATAIRSVRVFHNLIAVEKGANTEPSNRRLDPTHPEVSRALRMFAGQVVAAPAPKMASYYAELLMTAGRHADALGVIERALASAPQDLALLHSGINAATGAGRPDKAYAFLRRAIALAPDDIWVRPGHEKPAG